jgi:hypothetical protein
MAEPMTVDEYKRLVAAKGPRANKYHAKKTPYNGVLYDSKAEAQRAAYLDMLVKAKDIRGWVRQVTFLLGDSLNTYRADFVVIHTDGTVHAEDVKGFEDKTFKKNRKLWAMYGPCELYVVKRKSGGWQCEVLRRGVMSR